MSRKPRTLRGWVIVPRGSRFMADALATIWSTRGEAEAQRKQFDGSGEWESVRVEVRELPRGKR